MPRKSKRFSRPEPRDIVDFFTVNWALKLTALVLAFLLWSVVKAEVPDRIVIDDVPVRVDNRDENWIMVAPPVPATVSIAVSGPSRELLRLAVGQPDILVPVSEISDSTQIMPLRTAYVRILGRTDNVRVEDVRPASVELTFDRVATNVVPFAVRLTGAPVPGFEVTGPPQIDPPVARVSGAAHRVALLDSLRLPDVDLSGLSVTDTQTVVVDTTGFGVIVSPQQVRVRIPIAPLRPDSLALHGPAVGEPRSRRGGN